VLSERDREMLTKAAQTAERLGQDLREMTKCEDREIWELALTLLAKVLHIENRLKCILYRGHL